MTERSLTAAITGRVRYTRRAMQTFGKPDCKLYSFIICNILKGDGFVGTDGNCCKMLAIASIRHKVPYSRLWNKSSQKPLEIPWKPRCCFAANSKRRFF